MSKNNIEHSEMILDKIPEVVLYRKKLDELAQNWNTLNLLNQVNEGGASMESTQYEFNKLTDSLIKNLAVESLKQLSNEITSRAQVVVDIVIRNLFERTADIGFLATDDSIREFIHKYKSLNKSILTFTQYNSINESCGKCPEPFLTECKNENNSHEMNLIKEILCKNNQPDEKYKLNSNLQRLKSDMRLRFNEYVNKYSVYYDVIVTDTQGNVLVNLDEKNKIQKTDDTIIQDALNSNADYIEKLSHSDLRKDKETILTYAFRITQTNDKDSEAIGVLILCFDFEDEMEKIFHSLKEVNESLNLMLLDKNGYVISTSNKFSMPIGTKMQMVLDKEFDIVNFGGRKYITKSSTTKGYEGFYGLEWFGHVMVALDEAFTNKSSTILNSIEDSILDAVMHSSTLFSSNLQDIPIQAKRIQDDLNRTVWNGSLQKQTSIAKKLLTQVSTTGENTKLIFNDSISSLHETVLHTLLNVVSFQAFLGIDIMDRNLYERANDCRWWALTPKFREILSKQNIDNNEQNTITNILKYINNLYTVYTNLFVYDLSGKIISVSNDKYNNLIGTTLTQEWVSQTLSINNSQKYSVSRFEKSALYDDDFTYIYGASIKSIDNINVVGGIGIVFDSRPQFEAILNDILPQDDNTFALFCDKNKNIISSTNKDIKIGSNLAIESKFFELKNKESYSSIIKYDDSFYAVGSRCSSGYREYKTIDGYSNDVLSLVFIYLSKDTKENIHKYPLKRFTSVDYEKDSSEIIEFGTFFVKSFWYGFDAKDLDGAVGIEQLQVSHNKKLIAGRVFYKNELVEVINLHKYLDIEVNKDEQQQIVIMKLSSDENDRFRYLGLIVDSLGPISEIPKSNIQEANGLFFETENFVSQIAKPPKNENLMLSIIKPQEFLRKILSANK